MLRGAEKLTKSRHQAEVDASRKLAIKRDGQEQNTLSIEATTGQRGGVQGGEQRMLGLVTAAEECKHDMADRTAFYAPD